MDVGAVLVAFLTFAMLVPAAAPVASPSPSPNPPGALQEIGHVRVTSPLCRGLAERAVRAVGIETTNGLRLAAIERSLRVVDLDTSELAKARGTRDLTSAYVELRAAAVGGNGLMRQFRSNLATVSDPGQRSALAAFADALDSALHRQKALADDVGRLIAYLDAHPPIDKDTHDALVFNAILSDGDARYPRTTFDPRNDGPLAAVPDSLSTTAKNAADELTTRAEPIARDEDAAAGHIDAAFAGC